MNIKIHRVAAVLVLTLSFATAVAHAQVGARGFNGGAFPGGGVGAAGWRAGGGIAGGGWNAGGPAGAGQPAQVGNVPGVGFGRRGAGGFPGQGFGFNRGFAGGPNAWSNAHPHGWYNGHWHNHQYGNGFGGYRTFPALPPLSAVLTSNSAPSNPWDRFGTGSGMGGYAGGNYPLGWGQNGWGQGNQWYNSGYVPYYNPYYDPGITTAFNYGQPIPVPTGAKLADTDNPAVGLAIDKFRTGDYAKALSLIEGVVRIQPYDAAAHELRGLILFATQQYQQAAATIHSVLAIGPGWDWTTLSSIYSDMQQYQSQLAALERYVSVHPKQAGARFLLAYHYITAGHTDAAKEQLEQAVALVPSDKLAAELLKMVDSKAAAAAPPPAASAGQPAAVPAPPPANIKPVDPAALIGNWHAKRDDGASFELDLARDKRFTWKMAKKDQARTISGNYTLQNATLSLQGNQGAMVAEVTIDGANRFTFKPQGNPPDDPGLTFVK